MVMEQPIRTAPGSAEPDLPAADDKQAYIDYDRRLLAIATGHATCYAPRCGKPIVFFCDHGYCETHVASAVREYHARTHSTDPGTNGGDAM